ncbi:MAG: hypothetical protein RR855_12590 [Comamonas sp.]
MSADLRFPRSAERQAARAALVAVCVALAACSTPPVPDWSLNASDAAQRAMKAQLQGATKVADLEWGKARSEAAQTGQPALMARLALMRCALQVASLDWDDCSGYTAYAQDAALAEQAYHRYLYGALQSADVALLPAQHRGVGASLVQGVAVTAAQLQAIPDATARLVAAGAALRAGHTPVESLWPAVDATATAQGWRRPLMAWMELERRRLEAAGAVEAAQTLARRLAVLQAQP